MKSIYEWIRITDNRMNILLENFHFFHKPTTENHTDPKYEPEKSTYHQLFNWLKTNEATSASYLITGHRGAGKTSLVNYTINKLNQYDNEINESKSEEKNKTAKNKDDILNFKEKYIPIYISLGQENIDEIEILRLIARTLLEKFEAYKYNVIHYIDWKFYSLIVLLAILLLIDCLCPVFKSNCSTDSIDLYINMFQSDIEINIFDVCGTIINVAIFVILLIVVSVFLYYVYNRCKANGNIQNIYKKIEQLCNRLNATVSNDSNLNLNVHYASFGSKQKQVFSPASIQEIEFELISIFDRMHNYFSKKEERKKIIIIFDELDKVDTNQRNNSKEDDDFPEFEKLSDRPEHHVSSRVRAQKVLSIIAGMKYFLSTAKAYFIFIAGRELYEAFQSDMCDRDFSISSIFNGVLNVESFLTGAHDESNTTLRTEELVCRQILPPDIIERGEKIDNFDKSRPYSLKNYGLYMKYSSDKFGDDSIDQKIFFLYHFITYLTFISNGSPKKITLFFEKYVRNISYLNKEENIDLIKKRIGNDSDNIFYLSFSYRSIQKINFVHYLTYPIMQTVLNRNNQFGDKLMISASFLITYIFKLHNNGFSWRNLEQIPEIQELNKTPEMRDYLGSVINFMNHSLVTTIPCGLYHYKFPMRVIEEISYHSKLSGEMSALFNFSSNDLIGLKNQYFRLIRQNINSNMENGNASQYALASIHHSLGDLFALEENYSAAIRVYERSVELVSPIFEESDKINHIQNENYLLFLNRSMLKLGLAHEKRKTENSAFILYDELIKLLNNERFKIIFPALYYDTRTIHLAILAKLFVLEKIDTTGITFEHLCKAFSDFYNIHKVRDFSDEYYSQFVIFDKTHKIDLVEADFYRKMGDILYYKNVNFGSIKNLFDDIELSAKGCYMRSIKSLLGFSYNINDTILPIYLYIDVMKLRSSINNFNTGNSGDCFRDNYIYHLALGCESLGNVSLSEYEKENICASHFNEFCEMLLDIIDDKIDHLDQLANKFSSINNFERSILYYWTASRLYNLSCERGLSTKCYRNIVYVLLLYIRSIQKINSEISLVKISSVLNLVKKIINRFIISIHRQKEHIHLTEINHIQWINTLEMYESLSPESLSITPEIEEIILLYKTLKLEIWCDDRIKFDQSDNCSREDLTKDLASFYKSPIMRGNNIHQTLSSSILLLKLKARFNMVLLHKLLFGNLSNTQFSDIKFENIKNYEIGVYKNHLEYVYVFFENDMNEVIDYNKRMDLLDELIVDTMFCLSKIQKYILPMQNSLLFNNSFKADVFYNQYQLAYLYRCIYSYYSCNLDNLELIGDFIKLDVDHSSYPFVEQYERKMNLFEEVKRVTKDKNPNCTNLLYLGESCIHYYTKSRQTHSQGKTYQELIRNLYFLDDDLNNDCLLYMAIERLYLKENRFQQREEKLKEILSGMDLYNVDEYFKEQ